MAGGSFITEFRVTRSVDEPARPSFAGISRDIAKNIHQRTDLSAVYYAPQAIFANVKTGWPNIASRFVRLRDIHADSVTLFHCSTYAQRYDYYPEEENMKAIVLSKDYDISICTGRTFTRHYCSDLMYADRFFSYRFGDRKYWYVCYSSTLDDPELIADKLEDLFGAEKGQEIFAGLGHQLWCVDR
ncbi:MAG: hypothetical protein ACXV5T_01345 [Halobacteriota archaeon]